MHRPYRLVCVISDVLSWVPRLTGSLVMLSVRLLRLQLSLDCEAALARLYDPAFAEVVEVCLESAACALSASSCRTAARQVLLRRADRSLCAALVGEGRSSGLLRATLLRVARHLFPLLVVVVFHVSRLLSQSIKFSPVAFTSLALRGD